jgi:LuxR family maltose regulon positive regulatory protein
MEISSNKILLTTKLKIPAPRKNYIVRQALFEKLSQCADMSVIFVSGGAGTGKTTLLSSFIRETGLENVCWMSLDSTNTNVYSFWLYFTAAVGKFCKDDGSLLNLMRANPDASHMENLLIMLINRLCSEEDYYMVLDDIHCISDAALVRTFEFFIKSMPCNFHFFMLSRENPPIYLGTLAVSGRLLFIDGNQMQLSPKESFAFLKNTMKLTSSEEELNQLNTYAEGWIGGLQLAAAATVAGKNSSQLLRTGGGIAYEYLTREIIESLTQEEKDFLIKTGYLSYFDWEICQRIFSGFSRQDFNQMVEGLMEKNLFVICMDEQNGVYRYHNILSEYLTQQFACLPDACKMELYIKSAEAFEEKGDYEEALREYCAAGNYKEVLRVAGSMEGRIEAWYYLDKVPIDLLFQDADLAVQCFVYNFGNFNLERCRILFEKFKECYGDSDVFSVMGFAESYFTSKDGVMPQYYMLNHALTAEKIDILPLGSAAKAMLLIENASTDLEMMKYEEAEKCMKEAIQISAGSNVFMNFFAYTQLAQIYEEIGRLNDSLTCYARSKVLFKSPEMLMGIGTNYYFGLAGVYMRRMEIDKANDLLVQSKKLIDEQHIRVDIIDITLTYHLAEIKFLSGDDETAVSYVEGILSEYPNYNVLTLGRLIHELDCAKKLSDGLANNFLKELEAVKKYSAQPFMRLLRARILFKQGNTEQALQETDDILTFSRLHHNKLRLVEAGLLKIYMLLHSSHKNKNQREISNLMLEAIHYAREERILMPFYLDRATLLPLLSELYTKIDDKNRLIDSEVAFFKDILAICGHSITKTDKQELLSAREYEVLNELSLGITNREIAERLCISQATVKSHVLSIFGKLGVSSRMMAVDKARKEGIII